MGNSLDLNDFRNLKKIESPIKVNRSGSDIPTGGEPNSMVISTGGHKLIYDAEKRIKVFKVGFQKSY